METIDKDLDVREKFAGLRELKTPYKPIPYSQRRKDGTKVKIRDRAEAAVQFFEQEIWDNQTEPITKREKIMKQKLQYNTELITKEEFDEVLKKIKEGKPQDQTKYQWNSLKNFRTLKKKSLDKP